MEFSPITIKKRNTDSTNPFDLYEDEPGSVGFAERFDSEDDPFGLFSDHTSQPSPVKTFTKSPSGLRQMKRIESEEDDEDEATQSQEEEEVEKPAIPPRPSSSALDWFKNTFKEPSIPFDDGDQVLFSFLSSPLPPGTSMRTTISYDPQSKTLKLIHDPTQRIIFVATKRTDGLKAFSLSTNYSISMTPAERLPDKQKIYSRDPIKVAKLRGNTLGSQYSLFDSGKNPSKAAGMLDARRELMSVRFENIQNIFTRRATHVCLPTPNQIRRPKMKEDLLHERLKNRDANVISLSPLMPNASRLPRLDDFQGFAALHSVKNIMLHNPETRQIVFRFGKVDKTRFNMEFAAPFSMLAAFGIAVASIDSKIHPSRQL